MAIVPLFCNGDCKAGCEGGQLRVEAVSLSIVAERILDEASSQEPADLDDRYLHNGPTR